MNRRTKYVALDVHQTTTVASVREESGRVITRSILPTEESALVEFFQWTLRLARFGTAVSRLCRWWPG